MDTRRLHLCMFICPFALAATTTEPAVATAAEAITPQAAIACAAARYQGKPLHISSREAGRVHVLRWLTPADKVLEIRLAGPGCRFLEVRGVGQSEARISPAAPTKNRP